MGHRLSKIYTRTGDDGTTGLGDGTRVAKTHARIEAYGAVDEANSALGMVIAATKLPEIHALLTRIQHELFDLGGELSVPGLRSITEAHVTRLEQDLDRFNERLPPLKEFILPSGGTATAACHLARAITRRAERSTWLLAQSEPVANEVPQYLNRLSDLLFVIARVLVRDEQGTEVLWQREEPRKKE
jgi:cob(I)alamin adenosyltransferase